MFEFIVMYTVHTETKYRTNWTACMCERKSATIHLCALMRCQMRNVHFCLLFSIWFVSIRPKAHLFQLTSIERFIVASWTTNHTFCVHIYTNRIHNYFPHFWISMWFVFFVFLFGYCVFLYFKCVNFLNCSMFIVYLFILLFYSLREANKKELFWPKIKSNA